MAMRLSGLMSGMDTESIIQQLVEAKSNKVKTAKKAQTKLDWKRDAWKDLNTKLKNLQSKFLSNMRFSTAYTKKVTKVSNPNAVSVITGENAVNGVQSLGVDQLAKTGYLTGGVIDGGNVTAMTKISELDSSFISTDPNNVKTGTINVKTADSSVDIKITGDTTISDVLSQLKNAGLNASFDAKWKRFSISSKNSGAKNDFSITAVDAAGENALKALKLNTALDFTTRDEKGDLVDADAREYEKFAKYYDAVTNNRTDDDSRKLISEMNDAIQNDIDARTNSYLEQYKAQFTAKATAQGTLDSLKAKYEDQGKTLNTSDYYKNEVETRNQEIVDLNKELSEDTTLSEADKQAKRDRIDVLMNEVKDFSALRSDAESREAANITVENANNQMTEIEKYVTITGTSADDFTATPIAATLEKKVKDRYSDKAQMASAIMNDPSRQAGSATKVDGQDAKITLNGAVYENDTNSFEINGLTFTALAETKEGETVTVTTEQDVDGIYDLVKNFLKEYNSIINEMDKLYNADSAKGYEPLSDEEREAMSDSDIEKYEKKIKDSLLRRDENLSSVSSGLKSAMSSGIEVNGKTMYLFDFGIETLSYFTAAENEKNAYHIAGDPDDASTSGEADKLKTMIASDPDTVISFFTKLSQNMYDKMSDMSKSVDGIRTFGSFYDDKKMKSDYDDYTSKIKELEQKLNDYEDKWYKKFAAMETTMAKMQQNTNAVTALLGGS